MPILLFFKNSDLGAGVFVQFFCGVGLNNLLLEISRMKNQEKLFCSSWRSLILFNILPIDKFEDLQIRPEATYFYV